MAVAIPPPKTINATTVSKKIPLRLMSSSLIVFIYSQKPTTRIYGTANLQDCVF